MSITNSSFFILNDGTVKGCGFNGDYELGLGVTGNKTSPTLISGLSNVKQIACGYQHSVFLLNDGTVKACGDNTYGQTSGVKTTPTLISGLTNVKQIACGYNFTVALLNDGTVKTFGGNLYGQLGQGTNDSSVHATPTLITGLSNVKQVYCGCYHTIFLLNDGTVKACGYNTNGQLGLGDNTYRSVPTLISSLSNVKQIYCGYTYSVFLLNDGTVKSCGDNTYGQLGYGASDTTTTHTSPVLISGLTNVGQVYCGAYHTIFVLNDGTVKSCGYNVYGQLGVGSTTTPITTITTVSGLNNVAQVFCGYYHTIFLLNDSTTKVCGYNASGQLGLGDNTLRNAPTLISGLSVKQVYDVILTIIKFLIQDGTLLKTISGGNLVTVCNTTDSSIVIENAYMNSGLSDLSTLNNSLISQIVSSIFYIRAYRKT